MWYTDKEKARIQELEADIKNARYWVKWWMESHEKIMIEHWHNELKKLLTQYNSALDKTEKSPAISC